MGYAAESFGYVFILGRLVWSSTEYRNLKSGTSLHYVVLMWELNARSLEGCKRTVLNLKLGYLLNFDFLDVIFGLLFFCLSCRSLMFKNGFKN